MQAVTTIGLDIAKSVWGGSSCARPSISCVRLNGPVLKLALLWNGTLTRSAIGFCDCFARSGTWPLKGRQHDVAHGSVWQGRLP